MRRRLPAAALAAAVCLLAAACQGSTPAAVQLNPTSVAGQSAQTVAKYLAITPAPGTKNANPADGITVSARNGGKLGNVSVHTSGDAVTNAPRPVTQITNQSVLPVWVPAMAASASPNPPLKP